MKKIKFTVFLILLTVVNNVIFAQEPVICKTEYELRRSDTNNDLDKTFYYDSKSMFYYQVANDSNFLFVTTVVKDEILQKKILAFGNTLWINIDGEKKKTKGIQFPVYSTQNKMGPPSRNSQDDFNLRKFDIAARFSNSVFVGFTGSNSIENATLDSPGQFKLKLYFNSNGYLVTEYVVLLKLIDPKFNPNINKVFSIGLITGNLIQSQMQPPPSGGNREQAPPDDAPDKEIFEMTIPTKLWINNLKLRE